jgi:hypothetical protein
VEETKSSLFIHHSGPANFPRGGIHRGESGKMRED